MSSDAQVFPDKNPDLPQEEQGIYNKYKVTRVDGSDLPGGRHHGQRYFVLNIDNDFHARRALAAYADSCRHTHPNLSADIKALLHQMGAT
jgi:hypothetical protein